MSQCKSRIFLDGGMGHLLKQWGVTIPGLTYEQQFLAGCLALETAPDMVTRAHTAYIGAACDVITTNNFVATIHNLNKIQRGADVLQYCQRAGQLARQAAQASQHKVLVAGSLPPLMESYQTTQLLDAATMQAQYTDIARALAPHVDIFLAESLSTVPEALAALAAAAAVAPDKPVWVSFTLEDSNAVRLRDKQPLALALQQLHRSSNLAAALVNCCAAAAVTAAIPVLKQHVPEGVAIGGYANGFQTTTTEWLTGIQEGTIHQDPNDYGPDAVITPEAYLRHARSWADAGADIIGGCCGIGPQHIKLLVDSLGSRCSLDQGS